MGDSLQKYHSRQMLSRQQDATYRILLRLLTCPPITSCILVTPGTPSPWAIEDGNGEKKLTGELRGNLFAPWIWDSRRHGKGGQGFVRRREHSSQGDLQTRVPVKVWRGRQSEAISSCCIVGTSCLARVSNHADFWMTKLPNQPRQGRQCFPGHLLLRTGCTQHA